MIDDRWKHGDLQNVLQLQNGRNVFHQIMQTVRKTHIYAMIASRSLAEQPSRRVAIFVPWRTLAFQTCQMLGDSDGWLAF